MSEFSVIPDEAPPFELTDPRAEKALKGWETIDRPPHKPSSKHPYHPLLDTARLYAGWLLAWYGLVYLLGLYHIEGLLPFSVPFLQGIFLSSTVLSFAFATFLFLLLSGVWKTYRGRGLASALTIAWIAAVYLYAANIR